VQHVLYNGYAIGPIENIMDILYIMNWFSLRMTYYSQNLLMWDDMTDYCNNNNNNNESFKHCL